LFTLRRERYFHFLLMTASSFKPLHTMNRIWDKERPHSFFRQALSLQTKLHSPKTTISVDPIEPAIILHLWERPRTTRKDHYIAQAITLRKPATSYLTSPFLVEFRITTEKYDLEDPRGVIVLFSIAGFMLSKMVRPAVLVKTVTRISEKNKDRIFTGNKSKTK